MTSFRPLPFGRFSVAVLPDLACGVFENDVREDYGIDLVRQMRARAYTHVEGRVEVQVDGRAKLVHRFALQADEQREIGAGMVFASVGHPRKNTLAIRLTPAAGENRVAWSYSKGTSYVPSPLFYDGYLYQHALSTWENVAELRTRADNYSGGETVEDAFWQTLVAGNLSEQEKQEEGKECLRNEYLKWNEVKKPNWVLQKLGLGFLQIFFMAFALAMTFLVHKKPPASFQEQLQYVMFRRMIRTKRRRYIGLASGDIRQDDEVWLLEGSKVPLIIRKRIGGYGKLIGDAYIHGIMYGEAFHRSDCEDLMLE